MQFVGILVPLKLENVDCSFGIKQLDLIFTSFLTLEEKIRSTVGFFYAIQKIYFVRNVIKLLFTTVLIKISELRKYLKILVPEIE